jgi:hypothetical protein
MEAVTHRQAPDLFLVEDLEDSGKTSELGESKLSALRAVADWIETFVAKPNHDLGRPGPVCPFVPGALERKILWLAPEEIADLSAPSVVELMSGYVSRFMETPPISGDDAQYKVIVVVFTDLPPDRAQGLFDDVLQHLAVPAYAKGGVVFGPFYDGNEGTALYNSNFRPFQSPAPFLFVRQTVINDWKFFLDNEDLFGLWARRFGESAVHALAAELRHLPWRAARE